jgi:hypothetical protein
MDTQVDNVRLDDNSADADRTGCYPSLISLSGVRPRDTAQRVVGAASLALIASWLLRGRTA